jgi:cystathionine beta-lyase
MKTLSISTLLIHETENRERFDGLINPAIARTSTIAFPNLEAFYEEEKHGFSDKSYGRSGTSTVKSLAHMIAKLDGVDDAIITGCGLSAITTALISFLNSGDSVLIPDNVYICTRRFFKDILSKFGIKAIYYPIGTGNEIEDLIEANTKILFLESPGSGTFEIQDIPKLTAIAKKNDLITILDNTWATPLNFQPFKHGIDVTVMSLSKYINGHSDVLLGSITSKPEYFSKIHNTFKNYAPIPSPDDCYLALRGIRTLDCRLKLQSANSIKIASWLEQQNRVIKVNHPALSSFPTHHLWKRDFTGSSSTFSFFLRSSKESLFEFINNLQFFTIGLSWGGYESIILPLDLKRHRSMAKPEYRYNCVRVHVGLEDPDDLIMDLQENFKYLRE